MNHNETPQPHPVKCATPRCKNGVEASREIYCHDCRKRQQAVDPEAR